MCLNCLPKRHFETFRTEEVVKLVLIELTHVVKSESTRTEAVDGSNESSEHPDEELHPHLQKYSPLQKNFKSSSVKLKVCF